MEAWLSRRKEEQGSTGLGCASAACTARLVTSVNTMRPTATPFSTPLPCRIGAGKSAMLRCPLSCGLQLASECSACPVEWIHVM